MKHRLFTVLSALSLAMLVAVGVLSWAHGGPAGRLLIVTRPDTIDVSFLSYAMHAISAPDGSKLATGCYRIDPAEQWRGLGFKVWKARNGLLTGWCIWIPCYSMLAVTSVPPLWWLIDTFGQQRRERGSASP